MAAIRPLYRFAIRWHNRIYFHLSASAVDLWQTSAVCVFVRSSFSCSASMSSFEVYLFVATDIMLFAIIRRHSRGKFGTTDAAFLALHAPNQSRLINNNRNALWGNKFDKYLHWVVVHVFRTVNSIVNSQTSSSKKEKNWWTSMAKASTTWGFLLPLPVMNPSKVIC